jgi:hypothetical protein
MNKKIIKIGEYYKVCRISSPPDDEDKLEWLYDRFGTPISIELMFESLTSIIKQFDSGLKSGTVFEFNLIVRAEVDE